MEAKFMFLIALFNLSIWCAKGEYTYRAIPANMSFNGEKLDKTKTSSFDIISGDNYHIEIEDVECDEEVIKYALYNNFESVIESKAATYFYRDIDCSFDVPYSSLPSIHYIYITAVSVSGKEYSLPNIVLTVMKFRSGNYIVNLRNSGNVRINGQDAASISQKDFSITDIQIVRKDKTQISLGGYSYTKENPPLSFSLYLGNLKLSSIYIENLHEWFYNFNMEGIYAVTMTVESGEESLLSYFNVNLVNKFQLDDYYINIMNGNTVVSSLKVPDEGLIYQVAKGTKVAFTPIIKEPVTEYLWNKDGITVSQMSNYTVDFTNEINEADLGAYSFYAWSDIDNNISAPKVTLVAPPKPQLDYINIKSRDNDIHVNSDFYHQIEENQDINLIAYVNGQNIRYQWYKDGYPLNGEEDANLLIRADNAGRNIGRYTCMVMDDNYEIMSFPIDINVMATNNEEIQQSTIEIIPNKKEIIIHNGEGKNIYVINIMGQIVLQKELRNNIEHLPLPSGIYFIRINDKSYKVYL